MYTPKNNWTKKKILASIAKHVPTHPKGCHAEPLEQCLYWDPVSKSRCVIGSFLGYNTVRKLKPGPIKGKLYGDLKDILPLSEKACIELQKVHDDGKSKNARARCTAWVVKNVS